MNIIAGVDEAGVSPIAGPVVAAAVILNPEKKIYKLNDSKLLTEKQRNILYPKIKARALDVSIGIATVEEIDRLNIYHATMLAMERAIRGLTLKTNLILIDGRSVPKIEFTMRAIVKGDRLIKAISAASIIAKVTRDRMMQDIHNQFPQYNFQKHKGYPTKEHQTNLLKFGISPIHRLSFARVKNALNLAKYDEENVTTTIEQ